MSRHVQLPQLRALHTERDSASPWIFVGAALLFPPLGFLLFLLNKNVYCRMCGVRFKRIQRSLLHSL